MQHFLHIYQLNGNNSQSYVGPTVFREKFWQIFGKGQFGQFVHGKIV